jgi:hypothetical protein
VRLRPTRPSCRVGSVTSTVNEAGHSSRRSCITVSQQQQQLGTLLPITSLATAPSTDIQHSVQSRSDASHRPTHLLRLPRQRQHQQPSVPVPVARPAPPAALAKLLPLRTVRQAAQVIKQACLGTDPGQGAQLRLEHMGQGLLNLVAGLLVAAGGMEWCVLAGRGMRQAAQSPGPARPSGRAAGSCGARVHHPSVQDGS